MSYELKGNKVTVKQGTSVVYFTGGENGKDHEIGNYCFWTAVGEDDFGPWEVIGRAKEELPAVDRFQRMDTDRVMCGSGEDRAAYQMIWDRFDTVSYIRPSTMREIVRWIDSHQSDAVYAGCYAVMNGKKQLIPRCMI